MSKTFTPINLASLQSPQIIEVLNVETIVSAIKADLIARAPHLQAVLELESEDIVILLEQFAYRELLIRQRINDAAKATMLAFAEGSDLEHIGALFNIGRGVKTPADDTATPPTLAVFEDDTSLRRRIQLALEGFSTAGPRGAYIFHALSADADVKDATVSSPAAGEVLVSILSHTADGQANQALLDKVNVALNADNVRPLCDNVTVQSATIKPITIEAELTLGDGPDTALVLDAAKTALITYLQNAHKLGTDIPVSGIHAALHIEGVVSKVTLTNPTDDIAIAASEAGYVDPENGITLTIVGAA